MSKNINGYTLVFEPKIKRAYEKELGAGVNATDEEVLAYYDKFGGLVLKDGKEVKTGELWKAFCDKKTKKAEKTDLTDEEIEAKKAVAKAKKAEAKK